MNLHGQNIIGTHTSASGTETLNAQNPATEVALDPPFQVAMEAEVNRAVEMAASSGAAYRSLAATDRAAFLDRIAEELLALGAAVIERAHLETALPVARLTAERMRTVHQLRLFAGLIREGSWVEARIDRALPDRQPAPRPDLRRMLIPLGPVAVFGASNFPFAFSVAGGDTASALAAGNPVVVKAHPAHPGTAEMVARAVVKAAEATGMPDGVFSMLHGHQAVGLALVRHPVLQAVGFTGSLRAGRALFDAAAARPRPIPVYAEMGSINPVFVLPGALAERGPALATALLQSVTLGVGQFCTNPGLVVGMQSAALTRLTRDTATGLQAAAPATMLYAGICRNYWNGVAKLGATNGVQPEIPDAGESLTAPAQVRAALFSTTASTWLQTPELAEEVFGPSTLLVACQSREEMEAVAQGLEGQLTATIHGTDEDLREYRALLSILETKVGRLIFNGFPTGVEVSPAMQHGGPYPATTDSRTTSVGTAAIQRFARPLCYQDVPQGLLPVELQDANERGIWRLVDNELTRGSL